MIMFLKLISSSSTNTTKQFNHSIKLFPQSIQLMIITRQIRTILLDSIILCGGDFFSRRFHTDGSHLWKLVGSSPFQKKPMNFKERRVLQLPYRSGPLPSEDEPTAEISDLKVQVAVLEMLAEISWNKKSASAFESVVKKVSGIVVGIACSGVAGLRVAYMNALRGLASIDPDLIWLLLADVYYSKAKENISSPPPVEDLPPLIQLVPPPSSPKSYLYVQYDGQSYGFDIDFCAVEDAFKKLYNIL